jgi:peptidoglycan/xylan/chitin deacetylase (PgdA/CDA1 family)
LLILSSEILLILRKKEIVAMNDSNNKDKKYVALTFDDGPNLDITPLVLDKLEEHGVVASFFLIGKFINNDTKPILERQLQLGCEIENHSWNHNHMDKYSAQEITDEINRTNEIIRDMVEVTPQFFRPPYISLSPTMYEAIDLPFICGINCLDWDPTVSAKERAEIVLRDVKDGDIVLLHDLTGNKNTVDALDEIIKGLKEDGFTLVTVSKLFELTGVNPKVKNKIWTNTYS